VNLELCDLANPVLLVHPCEPMSSLRHAFFSSLLPEHSFRDLHATYLQNHGLDCFVHDAEGAGMYGTAVLQPEQCSMAVQESLRWGETVILMEEDSGGMYWSTPLMLNDELCGGMAVGDIRVESQGQERGTALNAVRQATEGLTQMILEAGLLNGSAMKEAKHAAEAEQEKAGAIHLVKNRFYKSIQSIFTNEEPLLLGAIRRGERQQATEVLNRILVAIYHYGADSQELRKSYLLELAAMMSRAAVEAGCTTERTLGLQFNSITQLAGMKDDADVSDWLRNLLDQLFLAMQDSREHPHSIMLNKALVFMEQHLEENLKRDEVARHVGMSSSHFAHMLTSHAGTSFREILSSLRVERASRMLSHGNRSLAEIAYVCGFSDQSHLSRVFSKAVGQSPGEYRKSRQNDPLHSF